MMIAMEDVRSLARSLLWEGTRERRYPMHLLGLGGVGSNALTMMLELRSDRSMKLTGYDMDTIELHNLNRTFLYSLRHIGMLKDRAVALGLMRVRPRDASVSGDWATFLNRRVTKETEIRQGLILDCRDTLDPTQIHERTWLKLAYNGGELIAFYFRPAEMLDRVVSSRAGNSYEVVPSFYVPAAMVSLFGLIFMTYLNLLEIPKGRAGSVVVNIDEHLCSCAYDLGEDPWEEEPAGQDPGQDRLPAEPEVTPVDSNGDDIDEEDGY